MVIFPILEFPLNPVDNSQINVLKDITIAKSNGNNRQATFEIVFTINAVWTWLGAGAVIPLSAPGAV